MAAPVTVDLGCGTYCRGDVGVDVQFWSRHPEDQPWKFDSVMGGLNPLCDRVMADLNYGVPIRDNAVSKVVMRAVLEHLDCPLHTLREAWRILKPGGRLLIVVPNCRVNNADWRDPSHLYSWTTASLEHLVSRLFTVRSLKLLFNNESIFVEAEKPSG